MERPSCGSRLSQLRCKFPPSSQTHSSCTQQVLCCSAIEVNRPSVVVVVQHRASVDVLSLRAAYISRTRAREGPERQLWLAGGQRERYKQLNNRFRSDPSLIYVSEAPVLLLLVFIYLLYCGCGWKTRFITFLPRRHHAPRIPLERSHQALTCPRATYKSVGLVRLRLILAAEVEARQPDLSCGRNLPARNRSPPCGVRRLFAFAPQTKASRSPGAILYTNAKACVRHGGSGAHGAGAPA